jgi:ribonuclease HII
VDEAGRGPLAGPVVAAAVVLHRDDIEGLAGLDDSKRLTPAQRDRLYDAIQACAQAVGVGIVEPGRIDKINILEATFEAMQAAVQKLGILPAQIWVDGNRIPSFSCSAFPLVEGDRKSLSIAAASVIAKVTRDRMMAAYDEVYPGYGFAKHKGYGTREHLMALERLGPSPIHRKSFAPIKILRLAL